jgi:hypothetical protein
MPDSIIRPMAMEDLDPDGTVAQSRLARMVLAYMTADPLMSTDVAFEINTDPRGAFIALHEALCALTASLAQSWTRTVSPEEMIPVIRGMLAALEAQGDSHE